MNIINAREQSKVAQIHATPLPDSYKFKRFSFHEASSLLLDAYAKCNEKGMIQWQLQCSHGEVIPVWSQGKQITNETETVLPNRSIKGKIITT
jgi:hypothetical protein